MRSGIFTFFSGLLLLLLFSCHKDNPVDAGTLQLISATVGNKVLVAGDTVSSSPVEQPIVITFTSAVDTVSLKKNIMLKKTGGTETAYSYSSASSNTKLTLTPAAVLDFAAVYSLEISSSLKGKNGETFPGVKFCFRTLPGTMVVDSIIINGKTMLSTALRDIDPSAFQIRVSFSKALDPATYKPAMVFDGPALSFSLANGNKTVVATNNSKGLGLTKYNFNISSSLVSAEGKTFSGKLFYFFTGTDSVYKYPKITDDELLTLVEEQTFKYFWDFGHPSCGMARERNSSGDVVTTGGSGFGVMAMVVAMERGFITRSQGLTRLEKILGFLETCNRFHGVWPHWMNGTTGAVVPFSSHDNGGDLVETSYMLQGLICMRQYLDSTVTAEKADIKRINDLFDAVEFDFYTNGQNQLNWAWSPDYGFNLRIMGYNETLITYIMAASSRTHSISKTVYTTGYANNGSIKNGQSYYGYVLPLGEAYGGPLFFTQYSFLGIDPRNLSDQYANYWTQNVNQSLINWAYCQADPHKFPGYGGGLWGLTASDNPWGYSAHSPTNDLGVITPTAAISAIPYTPAKSMDAIRTFYYFLGDRLWGDYGFYDAFAVTAGWWANSTLAIDQGPIICMIENYRTSLLWNLTMSAPEVQAGLTKLGFTF
jgi:hypothetical protein